MATPLEAAVLRLERAILRLERQPRPRPAPAAGDDAAVVALAGLQDRHDRLRTRVSETIETLDRLIAAGEEPA